MRLTLPALALSLLATQAVVAGETTKNALGGGLGGALGNVVGQSIGGSTGAAIGAGLGGAAGGAITARDGNKTGAALGGGLGAAGVRWWATSSAATPEPPSARALVVRQAAPSPAS